MCTERKSLIKECGWKDGDRGGLAQWQQTHGKKKVKVYLDINRPSHGRTLFSPGLHGKITVPNLRRIAHHGGCPVPGRNWDEENRFAGTAGSGVCSRSCRGSGRNLQLRPRHGFLQIQEL